MTRFLLLFAALLALLLPMAAPARAATLTDQDREILAGVLSKAGLTEEVSVDEFRLYGSARRLYHFHVDNVDAY